MEKKPQPTITEQSRPKYLAVHYSQHQALWGNSIEKINQYIELLADDLLTWAYWQRSHPDPYCAMTIGDFYDEFGIFDENGAHWCKKSKKFKEAHTKALRILGRIRQAGAMNKRYDTGFINQTLYQFSPEYLAANDYEDEREIKKIKARKETEESKHTIVIMPDIPKTTIVPEKK